MTTGRRIAVSGTVQGVGFRPFVYRLAREHGVRGRVRNDAGGVVIEAFAADPTLDRFTDDLRARAPGRVRTIVSTAIAGDGARGFAIVGTVAGDAPSLSIPPDLATCPECVAETLGWERRAAYPFTNCTRCGPRFTIALDVPYDRALTTMAPFTMCPDCRREYEDPADRRFHAQPIACPVCGPRLDETIEDTAAHIRAGRIVAVKGLGGFHLACDATSETTVALLRARKRRDQKPFAVMVADLEAAAAVAVLSDAEAGLLQSEERPITLVTRRGQTLAPSVAPDTPLVGLLLPYTPLHHLLMDAVRRPIVLTSANLSDEPICKDDDEARRRMAGIADAFLGHDRAIATRCDDSVARIIAGAPAVLRRSRGHVPRPVALRTPVPAPILACGAQLKNTFCLARGDSAYLGPHVGDLDNVAAFDFFREAIERMERLCHVRPEIIAHDLHPDYLSTRYARSRPEPRKVGVQHHHAHVASAMAEHGLDGEVLGLAWDGTGLGTDGAAWGGELLLARYDGFRRLGTFRPIALAGGDQAIRQPWRIAVALLDDAFDGEPPAAILGRLPAAPGDVRVVRQMIGTRMNVHSAHGVGRLFDGFAAFGLGRARSAYEGQLAAAWNHAADPAERGRYPFTYEEGVVDTRPMVRAAAADLLAGRDAGVVSARFHNTLVAAGAEMVRVAARAVGPRPVVLSGGCFANPILAEGLLAELGDVFLQRAVPSGDGGLALGQALCAAAIVEGSA